MSHPRHIGKQAEDQAAEYLLSRGYLIVTRRFKCRHGEIDLVVLDQSGVNDQLVFVEVKYRSEASPESAVGWTKRRHFDEAVIEYYGKVGQPALPARYDIVAVSPEGIKHIQDAFRQDQ